MSKCCTGALFYFCYRSFSPDIAKRDFPRDKLGRDGTQLYQFRSLLCFASYEHGTSFLYFSSPGGDGKYYGYWAEAESSELCASDLKFPNITTNAWGTLDISFDYDGNYWSGLWGYCNAQPTKAFAGERGGTLQTRSTQAEIKAAAAAHLLGMPYGETTADVMENIVSVSFGTDTLCKGPDNWTVEVYVRATANSDGITGSMVIDDANATSVCTGLPFMQ